MCATWRLQQGKGQVLLFASSHFQQFQQKTRFCEKAKSSTAAADAVQPFLPDCKKVFHLIFGWLSMYVSTWVCVCVCRKHFSALWIRIWSAAGLLRVSLAAAGASLAAYRRIRTVSWITCGFVHVAWAVKNLSFQLANCTPTARPLYLFFTLSVQVRFGPSRKLQLQRKSNFWPEPASKFSNWRFALLHISPQSSCERKLAKRNAKKQNTKSLESTRWCSNWSWNCIEAVELSYFKLSRVLFIILLCNTFT